MRARGRFVENKGDRVAIRTAAGIQEFPVSAPAAEARPGDWVEVTDGRLTVATPNRANGALSWMERVGDPRRAKGVETRSRVEAGIREFLAGRGFLETRTPLLVACPGMETDIRPLEVRSWSRETERPLSPEDSGTRFLPTSPEFAMKRLLAGGLEKIFQICPAFRDEPRSTTHRPEFTMLEWYRAWAGYEDIMRDTEELFEFLAGKIHGKSSIPYGGREISVRSPWPRLRVRDLFKEHAGVDLVACASRDALAKQCERIGQRVSKEDGWNDIYFRIWLNAVEPKLPADRAVFVTRYPASQSALAVIDTDPDGSRWARRFELYAGGIELGNAFEELTDPAEQRARFVKDMQARARAYGPGFPPCPVDEGFLGALAEGIPPSGGIAIGVDRMSMLYADESDIDYTFWL
jgi:elongation factor P--(R)-beta-lysine ligase